MKKLERAGAGYDITVLLLPLIDSGGSSSWPDPSADRAATSLVDTPQIE